MWAQDVAVPRRGTSLPAFLGWVLLGVCVGAGFGFPAAIGLVAGVAALLLGGVLVARQGLVPAQWGILTGLSALPFSIAWKNRNWPDASCAPSLPVSRCSTSMSPVPFVVVGVVLVVLGVVLFVRMRRAPRLIEPPTRTRRTR
ncbi:hypothetical protein [Cellulomonas sp. URHD0024]|uniref:hypothetical protein n=1 Tax=Cellulomonas sp. URHD0024 TaxID=1302620 RepID=UPI00041F80E2|nr:hypothetical protein [Cellulomonas sp. URHD0024]